MRSDSTSAIELTRRGDSESLAARARAVIPAGTSRSTLFVPPAVPMARSGLGSWLIDEQGTKVLDCNNNYTTLIHGHRFEPVRRAIIEALDEGISFGLPTRREVGLAELLRDRTGHEQWRFCNSGTEAVMQAIRCARAVTGRDVLVRFKGSYHGTCDAVTDSDKPGVTRAEQESTMVLPQGDLAALQAALLTRGPQVAAVIIDLMPNRAGLRPADPEFVKAVRELTSHNGALMIIDEVITFRLAYGGLCSSYDVEPDLAAFGKVIGGGLPVGALAGKAEVMAAFDPSTGPQIQWGGTFSANPLTVAAALAALTAYDETAIRDLNGRGNHLRRRISQAGVKVNGSGSLMRIMEPLDAGNLWWALYSRGVLAGTNGLIALSTAMSEDDIDFLATTVVEAVTTIRS